MFFKRSLLRYWDVRFLLLGNIFCFRNVNDSYCILLLESKWSLFAQFKQRDRLSIISRKYRVQPFVRFRGKKRVGGHPAISGGMSIFVVWLIKIGKACCKCRTNPYRYLDESQAQASIRWIKFVNSDLLALSRDQTQEIHAC